MAKIRDRQLYKELETNLTDKRFLKRIKMTKKAVLGLLSAKNWQGKMVNIADIEELDCRFILDISRETLESVCSEPEEGWLKYIFDYTSYELFPPDECLKDQRYEKLKAEETKYAKGRLMLQEIIHTLLVYDRRRRPFSPILDFKTLTEEELENCPMGGEYRMLLRRAREQYVYPFLRIGAEITPFNTVGHVAGVHHVAMFMAKQLALLDIPVDLSLIWGAAACHDIGKFGCRGKEAERIPYLHYYYTDQCMRREGMTAIAHIAGNHSTWDLELENLSVESLLLIYADFRVKSSREEDGKEAIHFYSLSQAFDVILNKLDNVDAAKEKRYRKVYAKLSDFENYMKSLGVVTDLTEEGPVEIKKKDPALLTSEEAVEKLKYLAIEHNISLMNKFNSEEAFGSLLEEARSEKQWKNLRAYINILKEYFTYMTKKQKQMTIHFLFDLLVHREGDIRRQAAALNGVIMANYHEEYTKEMPSYIAEGKNLSDSNKVWEQYLENIIYPDHKTTDQHKSWMGYTLKITLRSILQAASGWEKQRYLKTFTDMTDKRDMTGGSVFVMLDSLLNVPVALYDEEQTDKIFKFAAWAYNIEEENIRIGVLRLIKHMTRDCSLLTMENYNIIMKVLDPEKTGEDLISVNFLKHEICMNLGDPGGFSAIYADKLDRDRESTSDIFLENLKVGTPWVVKAVNIEYLMDGLHTGAINEVLHIATHLSNLIKVSERVTVRHIAGKGLINVIKMLPLDQRNELVIELMRGLEIGEYQFSKYIPEYLGPLALHLRPEELDEFIINLRKLLESNNDKVVSVTLDTIGEVLEKYPRYKVRFPEDMGVYDKRKTELLGMLLRGIANYHETVSQEAVMVTGQYIFGSKELDTDEKFDIFRRIYKKLITFIEDQRERELSFFTNAASLNHIYRFISEYMIKKGGFDIKENRKVAFFPGTFDPFSLSHKGIVQTIRNKGFEVYLALDEFSWSKKTQPRMIRRRIITMSVADEGDVYIFPDDIPVNIANPNDLKRLNELFPGREIYMVVGSDVVINASSYKKEPEKNSIHYMNHVVFKRESLEQGTDTESGRQNPYGSIKGKVLELTLPVYLEDISSTRIRENIDQNRDISNLIDPIAQNYIYDNSLYLREGQYKDVMENKSLEFSPLIHMPASVTDDLAADISAGGHNIDKIRHYIDNENVKTVTIRDGKAGGKVIAFTAVSEISTSDLFREFKDVELASYIREKATGKIISIGAIYARHHDEFRDLLQLVITETLAQALKEDYTYAVYNPIIDTKLNKDIKDALERQGFTRIIVKGQHTDRYAVEMKNPVVIMQDMDTILKAPFDKNERIQAVIDRTRRKMQRALTKVFPGSLVLSFNSGVMYNKLVEMITIENNVPKEPLKKRKLGDKMCVPFGEILRGKAVPNTVTKALHTEKRFNSMLDDFSIVEYPYYSPIPNQIKTIKSFERPVILVDDLLHKGYRIKELDPVFKEIGVDTEKIIVGLLSGRGKDLMTIQNRKVESIYFIPNMRAWFVESLQYPFIGGNGLARENQVDDDFVSVNLILPYAAPKFMLATAGAEEIYDFSMVCLENAREIFLAIEEEYQDIFERKLTLGRVSEAIVSPRMPDTGSKVEFDPNLSPSGYLKNDIERLIRLKGLVKK